MYGAILNGIVGVHIDKRVAFSRDLTISHQCVLERYLSATMKGVAIGTRSANQNPEFRRICRGVPIEAGPYEYSISFLGDLIRDTAHAQRQFRLCPENENTQNRIRQ